MGSLETTCEVLPWRRPRSGACASSLSVGVGSGARIHGSVAMVVDPWRREADPPPWWWRRSVEIRGEREGGSCGADGEKKREEKISVRKSTGRICARRIRAHLVVLARRCWIWLSPDPPARREGEQPGGDGCRERNQARIQRCSRYLSI